MQRDPIAPRFCPVDGYNPQLGEGLPYLQINAQKYPTPNIKGVMLQGGEEPTHPNM